MNRPEPRTGLEELIMAGTRRTDEPRPDATRFLRDPGAAWCMRVSMAALVAVLMLLRPAAAIGYSEACEVVIAPEGALDALVSELAVGPNGACSGLVTYRSLEVSEGCGNGVVDADEQCDGGACCTADCTFIAAGSECRASAGVCDVAEQCSGTSAACPADGFVTASTVCRAAAGPCDVAEACSGSSAVCPSDGFVAANNVCRAAAGSCDVAETCSGSGAACPSDDKAPAGTECRAASGPCDVAEACNGTADSCPADALAGAGSVCRAAAGDCDVSEVCDGTTTACPADALAGAGTQCRAAAGVCDAAEVCSGASAACPADGKVAAGTSCRAAAGACDASEACDGTGDDCPADALAGAGTLCRASAGACDSAEVCSGTGAECPADELFAAMTPCRAAAGPCDVTEVCSGTGAECPPDELAPATVECRASAGPCDSPEACTGAGAGCPEDGFASSTTECRPAAGACDLAETCTGTAAACPADVLASADVVCRAAADACDVAEACTGSSGDCPTDGLATAGTVCRATRDTCDVAEACDGLSAACPTDFYADVDVECRGAHTPCDLPESCNGTSPWCPVNAFAPAGTGPGCTGDSAFPPSPYEPPQTPTVEGDPCVAVARPGRSHPWEGPFFSGNFQLAAPGLIYNSVHSPQNEHGAFGLWSVAAEATARAVQGTGGIDLYITTGDHSVAHFLDDTGSGTFRALDPQDTREVLKIGDTYQLRDRALNTVLFTPPPPQAPLAPPPPEEHVGYVVGTYIDPETYGYTAENFLVWDTVLLSSYAWRCGAPVPGALDEVDAFLASYATEEIRTRVWHDGKNPTAEAPDGDYPDYVSHSLLFSCSGVTTCANGVVEPGEDCDDGNLVSSDGCSASCTLDTDERPPRPHRIHLRSDRHSNEVLYERDDKDRIGRIVGPTGLATTFTWEEVEDPTTKLKHSKLVEIKDPEGRRVTFVWTGLGTETDPFLLSEVHRHPTDGAAAVVERLHYEVEGQLGLISKREHPGVTAVTHFEFHAGSRDLMQIKDQNDQVQMRVDYIRDETQKLKQVVITEPFDTRTAYNCSSGVLSAVIDSSQRITRYWRNDQFRIREVIDPSGHRVTAEWAGNSLLHAMNHHTGDFVQYFGHDAAGNPAFYRDSNGRELELDYTYDHNPYGDLWRWVDLKLGDEWVLLLNSLGDVLAVTRDLHEVASYEYRSDGQVKKAVDDHGRTTIYDHDAHGNLISVTYPDGRTVSRTASPVGRTLTFSRPAAAGPYTISVTPDGWGAPKTLTHPNGATVGISRDFAGLEQTVTDGVGGDEAQVLRTTSSPFTPVKTATTEVNGKQTESIEVLAAPAPTPQTTVWGAYP